MYEIRTQKNEIRARYKDKRASLAPEQKRARDAKVCSLFLQLATFRFADTLLLYAPKGGEIDINPVIDRALELGKRVALPRCDAERAKMTYHFITSRAQLKPGAFGILEPDASLPVYDPLTDEGNAVCVVPALVFDKNGFRLGYGKGYYDRYLPAFKGTKVGVIYQDFILNRVPRGRYDLAVDVMVTDKGVRALSVN